MVSEGVINAVAKLKDKGKTPVQIAEQLNLSVSAVLDAIDDIERDYGEDTKPETEPEPSEESEDDLETEIVEEVQAAFEPKKRGRKKGWKKGASHSDDPITGKKPKTVFSQIIKTNIAMLDEVIAELQADLEALQRAREILTKK